MNVIHFHNGTGGGVLSVIRNLLEYRQNDEIRNHVVYTINVDLVSKFQVYGLNGAVSEKIFYYSPQWNFYYTCRQLSKYLIDDKSVIIAHDWLELGMVSNLGLVNPVIQFIHGAYKYYYELAIKHEKFVDLHICVAGSIADELRFRMPHRKEKIIYLRFPVPAFKLTRIKHGIMNVIFAGRCESAKGYYLLPQISELVAQNNLEIKWHIAGPGSEMLTNQIIWKTDNVIFYGNLSVTELTELLSQSHVFILPSTAEGMPVSVIEAMKAGVTPVVNNLVGGLEELVINQETGFRIRDNSVRLYADILSLLSNNLDLTARIGENAKKLANELFDPVFNTAQIEIEIIKVNTLPKRSNTPCKIYGSRLDHPIIPNSMTYCFRSLTRFFGGHYEI
jgi:glycosyltransferase involved in cell wall biosynthesis